MRDVNVRRLDAVAELAQDVGDHSAAFVDLSGGGGASLLEELVAQIFDPGGHDTLVHTDNVEVILNNGWHNGKSGGYGSAMRSMASMIDRFFEFLGRA